MRSLPYGRFGDQDMVDVLDAARRAGRSEHLMDRVMDFCVICGKSAQEIVDKRLLCCAATVTRFDGGVLVDYSERSPNVRRGLDEWHT